MTQPVGFECRFATYCESNRSNDDALAIKEYVYDAEGNRTPRVRIWENYEREFWVTKEAHRKHRDKLEWDEESKLQVFKTTQRRLPIMVSKALGRSGSNMALRHLAKSPYVYGYDISTTALVKEQYARKYAKFIDPLATVAALDIETDVVWGTGEVLMVGLTFRKVAFVAVTQKFIASIPDAEAKIRAKFEDLLSEFIAKREITLELVIVDCPGAACKAALDRAHQLKPDFIEIWNIDFDLPRMVTALENDGYSPADVFSDPAVPEQYRFYRYKQGPNQKVTETGKVTPIHPADRWHTAWCPASFYFIDGMCVYKKIRIAAGQEASYSLDAIMKKHLNLGKLKFAETDHLSQLAWHVEMQSNYQVEYIVYNLFDCIGLELLDEKIGDVGSAFCALVGVSDFATFPRNPRRIADDMHFYCRDRNLVIATTSDDMVDELDKFVISMKDHILIVPSYLMDNNGIAIIRELPNLRSMTRGHGADIDITGTYPNIEQLLNISKETTYREFSRFKGLTEQDMRMVGQNLSGGIANTLELCNRIYSLPTPDVLLNGFMSELGMIQVA